MKQLPLLLGIAAVTVCGFGQFGDRIGTMVFVGAVFVALCVERIAQALESRK